VVSNPVKQLRDIVGGIESAPNRYISIIFVGTCIVYNNRHLDIYAECQRNDRTASSMAFSLRCRLVMSCRSIYGEMNACVSTCRHARPR
jgi:hypothetical protein